MKTQTGKAHICSLLVLISLGVLSAFFAPTHDDLFEVANRSFDDAFRYALHFGNGRYIGNMFVVMFLNQPGIDVLLRTVFIGGTVILSAVFAVGYTPKAILTSYFLYLSMRLTILSQVFVWGHGFYNYVPPVCLLLLALCLLKQSDAARGKKAVWIYGSLLFITMLAAQFFAENSTTVNVLVMVLALVRTIKEKRKKAGAIAAVSGAILGAAIMFLGPWLMGVTERMDGYREVSTTVQECVATAAKNAFEIVTILSSNWGLFLVLSLAVFMAAKKNETKLPLLCKAVLIGFVPLALAANFVTADALKIAADVLFAVYIACAVMAFVKVFEKEHRRRTEVGAVIVAASIVQLLAVSPIGSRCLFLPYAGAVLCVMYLFADAQKNSDTGRRFCKNGLLLLSGMLYAVLLVIHVQVWNVHTVRMDYAQAQLAEGKTHIEIVRLPHEAFLYSPNESYVYPILFNHGNEEEMQFSFISYGEYCEKVK